MVILSIEKRQLCDIQGRLFELALEKNCDCPKFVEAFMNSKCAAALDDTYDRLQWSGEEYILDELDDEVHGLERNGVTYSKDVMYWTGYAYRYWHYYKGLTSKDIYKISNAEMMNSCWLGFHTLDIELAIDNLIEIKEQKIKDYEK